MLNLKGLTVDVIYLNHFHTQTQGQTSNPRRLDEGDQGFHSGEIEAQDAQGVLINYKGNLQYIPYASGVVLKFHPECEGQLRIQAVEGYAAKLLDIESKIKAA